MSIKSSKNHSKQQGFTIIELIVVFSIIGIFVLIATPSMTTLMQANAKRAAREMFQADLLRLRSMAISNNARGIVTFGASSTSYTLGLDYYPYNIPDNADTTTARGTLPRNVTTAGSKRIVFNSRGYTIVNAGTVTTANITFAYSGSTYATATLNQTGVLQ
ncbi:MAG: GspH/FimT family pseudopilin [bacterium]|nr:GspH/FimT family pseudopilin [bacterium]